MSSRHIIQSFINKDVISNKARSVALPEWLRMISLCCALLRYRSVRKKRLT